MKAHNNHISLRCKARERGGKPCRRVRMRNSDYCFKHNNLKPKARVLDKLKNMLWGIPFSILASFIYDKLKKSNSDISEDESTEQHPLVIKIVDPNDSEIKVIHDSTDAEILVVIPNSIQKDSIEQIGEIKSGEITIDENRLMFWQEENLETPLDSIKIILSSIKGLIKELGYYHKDTQNQIKALELLDPENSSMIREELKPTMFQDEKPIKDSITNRDSTLENQDYNDEDYIFLENEDEDIEDDDDYQDGYYNEGYDDHDMFE